MGLVQLVQSQYQAAPKYVTRTGVATDCATQHTVNLFTVAGGNVLLIAVYGKVMADKAIAAQTLRLGLVPTIGGVEAFLCAASATTSGDLIDSIYTITGVIADLMIVAPTALGVALPQAAATGQGVGALLVLVPGIIRLTTGAADDGTGLINWTVLYRPLTADSVVTVL